MTDNERQSSMCFRLREWGDKVINAVSPRKAIVEDVTKVLQSFDAFYGTPTTAESKFVRFSLRQDGRIHQKMRYIVASDILARLTLGLRDQHIAVIVYGMRQAENVASFFKSIIRHMQLSVTVCDGGNMLFICGVPEPTLRVSVFSSQYPRISEIGADTYYIGSLPDDRIVAMEHITESTESRASRVIWLCDANRDVPTIDTNLVPAVIEDVEDE